MKPVRLLAPWMLLLAATTAQSAVPHVFRAGEPARAEEVNENFDTLVARATDVEQATDALEARVARTESELALLLDRPSEGPRARIVDGDDRELGPVLGVSAASLEATLATTLTGPTGPVTVLLRVLGPRTLAAFDALALPIFEADDCTGPIFVQLGEERFRPLPGLAVPFAVIGAEADFVLAPHYQIVLPASSEPREITLGSRLFFDDALEQEVCAPIRSAPRVLALPGSRAGRVDELFVPPFRYVLR
ncbi:MAG: hypothetical protein V2J02_16945 [Pseudomonadales bacterium]|jgi:hypothetical protein|nr:hypothetical protein [Pseudomonadales bacterium]